MLACDILPLNIFHMNNNALFQNSPILNKYSRIITEPKSQGASQAMLYATGLNEKTISSPQVGICSVWFEGNPCNMHLLDLSGSVKEGVQVECLI